jgi:hypothetical protein
MKRFGILFLLSASYAGLLTLIFSTDFSRENSFLLDKPVSKAAGKAFDAPVMAEYAMITDRIASMDRFHKQNVSDADKPVAPEQSPESAGN